MREYKVTVTPLVQERIRDVVVYVRDELSMPKAAEKLLGDFTSSVEGLSKMPTRFHRVELGGFTSMTVRRMNVRDYSVFYTVDEGTRIWEISGISFKLGV